MNEVIDAFGIDSVPQPMGPRLRVARENAGFTEAGLARRVGVTLRTVHAWESDKAVPRANRLQMLAGVLGVTLTWLLEGREDEFMEAQSAAPEIAIQKELERLNATLDEVKAMTTRSLNRLSELSNHPDLRNTNGHRVRLARST